MSDQAIERDFYQRPVDEQASLLKHTWCDSCQQADLGMVEPREYLLRDTIFIEGRCAVCGQPVFTELSDDEF